MQLHQLRASTWSKAEDRVRRIIDTLGSIEVGKLQVEHIVTWQSRLLKQLAPKTVGHHRQTLAQIMDQAVELGLAVGNPVRRVKAPRVPPTAAGRSPSMRRSAPRRCVEQRPLRGSRCPAVLPRLPRAVSEALGLAWSDLDLDAGIAVVRRACIYVDHQGAALGPTKTAGAMGDHQLVPTVADLLRRRRKAQAAERLASAEPWPRHIYEGRPVDLVFTTPTGDLLFRQAITKAINTAAARAGIDPTKLGTHTGRRSVLPPLRRRGRVHRRDRTLRRPRLAGHDRRVRSRSG